MKLYLNSVFAVLVAAPAVNSALVKRSGDPPPEGKLCECNTNDKSASVDNINGAIEDMKTWESQCAPNTDGSTARMAAGGK